MKKLLLSLSLLASVMVANAQQFVLWNSTTGTSQLTAVPFNFGSPANATIMPTSGGSNDGLYVDTTGVVKQVVTPGAAPYIIQANGNCIANDYYVGGFGIGNFSSPGVGKSIMLAPTNLSNYYLNFKINCSTTASIQIQMNAVDSTNTQAYIQAIPVTTGYQLFSIPLANFSNTIGQYNNPVSGGAAGTPNNMSLAFADSIFKIQWSVNVGSAGVGGAGTTTFSISDIWFSTGTSTGITATQAQVAANISSTVVYPNPAASVPVSSLISLQNASQVTAIVTDLTGRQVVSKDLGTVPATAVGSNPPSYGLFDSSSLAKGMYTVTYVVNGTSAKTDLVVVQ
jgi:hypothetical protein